MYVFLSSVGLLIASFLGVIVYRYPRKLDFVWGRSKCDSCKAIIPWYQNIPIISYLVLGGKCANCKVKIPLRYFLLEILLPFLFILIYSLSPTGINPVIVGITAFFMLAIFFIDYEHQIIPDVFVFIPLAVTIFYFLFSDSTFLFSHLFSGLLAASLLMLIHLITLGRGMGLGDVKFALLAGIYFDFYQMLIWLFISFLTGAVIGVILLVTKKAKLGMHIPFGPFLVFAFFIELFMQL